MNQVGSVIQIGNFSYYPNKIIGQGATGSVYLGRKHLIPGFKNHDMSPIAVKAIKLKEVDTDVKKHLLNC